MQRKIEFDAACSLLQAYDVDDMEVWQGKLANFCLRFLAWVS